MATSLLHGFLKPILTILARLMILFVIFDPIWRDRRHKPASKLHTFEH